MSPNSTHNTNPNRPPNVINHIRSSTQPKLLEVYQRVLVDNNDTLSHSKQRHHTRQVNSQTEDKWFDDFSTFPHKSHTRFSTTTHRLSKFTLIAILFSITLQAVNKAEDIHLTLLDIIDKNIIKTIQKLKLVKILITKY